MFPLYTPAVRAWLEVHPTVRFHFAPTGASWLNLIEVWFSILTRKSVRRGSFDTVRALMTHIHRYIDSWMAFRAPPSTRTAFHPNQALAGTRTRSRTYEIGVDR